MTSSTIREALTFDDVLLVPGASEVLPGEVDTRTRLTKSVELGIRVKAIKDGFATCRVYLMHDELTAKLANDAAFRVMPTRR